ncbi:2-dehydropantoate 2-reductase [Methylosoma difficile]
MTINVLVIGTGAVGGFYGALLAKAGARVSVLCRSDYAVVKQHGFSINSTLGNWQFKPAQVVAKIADYQGVADVVLLCTKIIPAIDRVALIREAVGDNTAIVFIQNGVAIEAELQAAFPNHEIVSALAFLCCNRTAPGQIQHLAYGRLVLGNLPGFVSVKTELLAELFRQAGIACETTADIVAARWQKCIWNAPFNPLSVLSGGLPTLAILQSQEALVREIMQEVVAIAAASGHHFAEDIIDKNIDLTYSMPPYKTSMLLDFERGQAMETEAILGNAVRAAQLRGVPCPHLQSLYGLLKLRELQLSLTGKKYNLPNS